jgi:hypothetical protein
MYAPRKAVFSAISCENMSVVRMQQTVQGVGSRHNTSYTKPHNLSSKLAITSRNEGSYSD